jgi:serine/threonine protein kinase
VAIAAVTQTLAALAEHAISHRDLKPDNLFRLDEVWSVGDFGLVKYPSSAALTRHGRRLGPIDSMAPEMRESPDTADGERATSTPSPRHCGSCLPAATYPSRATPRR